MSFRAASAGESKTSPALQAIAEANNREYLEVKALGPHATPEKMAEIHKRVFAPALQLLKEERAQKMQDWGKTQNNELKRLTASFIEGSEKKARNVPETPAPPEPRSSKTIRATQQRDHGVKLQYSPSAGKKLEFDGAGRSTFSPP